MKDTAQKTARTPIDFAFGDNEAEIQPKKEKRIKDKPSETVDYSEEIRVTLQMPKELHQKVKIMANFEFSTIKDVINESLKKTIGQYEKTHGELVKVPKSKKASE